MTKAVEKIVDPLDVIGKMLEGDKPKLPAQKVMPDPDDKQAKTAALRNSQRRRRSGRTSTILADSKLG